MRALRGVRVDMLSCTYYQIRTEGDRPATFCYNYACSVSCDFIVLDSLEAVERYSNNHWYHSEATAPSILDCYTVSDQQHVAGFTWNFTWPEELNAEPNRQSKKVIVIA